MTQRKTPIFGLNIPDLDFSDLAKIQHGEIKYRLSYTGSWQVADLLTAAIKQHAEVDASKLTLAQTLPALAEMWHRVDLPLGLQAQLDELSAAADTDLGLVCYSYHFAVVTALRARNRKRVLRFLASKAMRREVAYVL